MGALPLALAGFPSLSAGPSIGLTPLQIVAASGVALSGTYPGHLQGVCTNDRDAIYWSMTTHLVKTDAAGNIVRQVAVPTHHGDLCHVGGRLYVAVNLGLFNDAERRADSWIYVYDAEDLSLLARHALPDLVYGAGGVAFGDGRFIVVGGLPEGAVENAVYAFDMDFTSGRRIALKTGQTFKGIQTAAFDGDHWWFGCYGKPDFTEVLIRADRTFASLQRLHFDASTGIVPLDGDTFLIARSACGKESCVARLAPARLNAWIETGRLKPI
ncbi:MAG: hypothetical protein ACT6RD_04945 [Brevundimonas sp.]|uniref:hypothetical protein n=1 Tax=Brevundimonas sp. TaxID=1871086 RepID=UPI0040347284